MKQNQNLLTMVLTLEPWNPPRETRDTVMQKQEALPVGRNTIVSGIINKQLLPTVRNLQSVGGNRGSAGQNNELYSHDGVTQT